MDKQGKQKRRNGRIEDFPKLCMFCAGEINENEFTAEHFVPKCFYEKLLRDDVDLKGLELPAHKNCNNSFSADNEYVRNVLAGGLGAENSSGAKALVNGLISNFMKNSSDRKLKETYDVELRPVYTNSGIYLGDKPLIKLEWPRIKRVLFNIMRGIYYKVSMQPMPADFHLCIMDASTLPREIVEHNMKAMVLWQTVSGDPDVFQCCYALQEVNEKVTEAHFLINLFENYSFLGSAHSEESLVKYQRRDLFKPSSSNSKVLVPFYLT
ncbi:MAG: hypothetical protein JKY95_10925 [Planctomycetaceae bacterium]|nr:hypothetical protein [Planctomycetaceae bacterium]